MDRSARMFEGKLLKERPLPSDGGSVRSRPGVARPARSHSVNLAESPLGWLHARGHVTTRQFDAGERLRWDWERAQLDPQVTMRWDALPRVGAGGAAGRAPSGAPAAARRLEAALAACGPARGLVDAVCVRASALQAAEQDLGLRRRAGKQLLQAGLSDLARHYRIG